MENHPEIKPNFRSGFVAIIGPPNVGKSTLLNTILGHKVAITTPKPQTTRKLIRGILTGENYQIVFVDTPGIHESKKIINKLMVKMAKDTLEDVDVILFVVDASRRDKANEFAIIESFKKVSKPILLVINKIDLIAKENLLPMIEELNSFHHFDATIPISALYGDNVDSIIDEITKHLPEGPPYYDPLTFTDQRKTEFIAEIIREKIFLLAEEEVPYSTHVSVEHMEEDDTSMVVYATIFVEKPSQKGILIGKDGRFIVKVKKMALQELKMLFNKKIELNLWVKVSKDWSKDERKLKQIGYI